jgi:hypothetical protein
MQPVAAVGFGAEFANQKQTDARLPCHDRERRSLASHRRENYRPTKRGDRFSMNAVRPSL